MSTSASVFSFLPGGGATGACIRSVDWEQTPVGAPETWPQSLRTALSIMLDTHFPMYIAWGKDFTQFYNDSYRPILGSTKHPAIGLSTRETFAEIWDIIGPMFEGVMEGEAVGFNDYMLPLDRHGYVEECYFIFSYSPIRDESGGVGGVLVTVTETTDRVLGERRIKTLRELAEGAAEAKSIEQAYSASLQTLNKNPNDLPFSLCYILDEDTKAARLAGFTGLENHEASRLTSIDLTQKNSPWSLSKVAETGKAALIKTGTYFSNLPGGAWPEPSVAAYVIPVSRPDRKQPFSILVLGISPRRAFDENYRDFFTLLADHISTAVANSTAFESEKKRAEALAEIDHAKTIFFSNISHEFRTPLTLMLSPLESAIKEAHRRSAPAAELENLSLLHRNTQRLLKLVNNLLDFSKIEAGRLKATFEPTDLCELTADLTSSFRSTVEHAGMSLKVDCQPLPEAMYIDRDMWEKIILNLLSNAYKYTLQGTISVSLRQEDNRAVLTVSDTGVGISKSDLPHIFERFYRVQNTRGRTYEGTGIGLSLVMELVKLHGGDIGVKSTQGEGTAFTVKIPMGKSHLPPDQIQETPTANSTHPGFDQFFEETISWNGRLEKTSETASGAVQAGKKKGKYILVADDNADMRQFITRLLQDQFIVKTVPNGVEAWQEIQRSQPDLVISDISMPQMDGISLVQQLRTEEHTRSIPVIFLSARAGEDEVVKGMKMGADDYLVKPFSSRELVSRIEANLRISEIREIAKRNVHNIFEQAPVAICMLRGKDFIIDLANEKALELWDKSLEQTLGKPTFEVFPELIEQGFREVLTHVYTTGERFINNDTPIELFRNGKLSTAYINFVYEPLRDAENEITGIIAIGVEVTGQNEARRKVEASEKNFRNLIGQAPVAICIYRGPEFTIELANKECLELWNRTKEEVIGSSLFELFPHSPEQKEMYNRVYIQGERLTFKETPIQWTNDPEADIGWYNFVLEPLRDENDNITGVMGLGVDVTEHIKSRKQVEESDLRLRLALETAEMGTWDFNLEEGKVTFSPRTLEFFGFPSDKPIDLDITINAILEEEQEAVKQAVQQAIMPGSDGKYEIEHTVVNQVDGKQRLIRAKGQAYFNEKGEAHSFIGTALDITEQRKVRNLLEQEIKERTLALTRTNQIFGSAEKIGKFGSYAYDYLTGNMSYSDNLYYLLGCEPGEFEPGDPFYEFVHPDDKEYILSKARVEAFEKKQTGPWEYRAIRKDGEVIWMRSTGQLLTNDDGSEWLIGTVQDITGEKMREQKISEANRVLEEKNKELLIQKDFVQTMIDSSVDFISVYDKETRIVYINKVIEELYGIKREAVLGKKFLEVFPEPDDYANILKALEGETVHVPIVNSIHTGHIFEDFYIPLFDNDDIYAVLSISHDNTKFIEAREKLKEAEDKNRELEQFAYLASHDLQEPLNTIASFSDLLQEEEDLSDEGNEYLKIIQESSSRLKLVINDLLAYSRIGKQSELENTDLNKLLNEILIDMQATISAKNACIEPGRLPAIPAHPSEMRLLFQNLISNAIKFHQPGQKPVVKISAKRNGKDWHFVVSDNGIGIEEKYRERIFLIFQRLHTFNEYEGTGIGLAHCQKIINLHGGKLWLESEPGKGSHFHFTIPENL